MSYDPNMDAVDLLSTLKSELVQDHAELQRDRASLEARERELARKRDVVTFLEARLQRQEDDESVKTNSSHDEPRVFVQGSFGTPSVMRRESTLIDEINKIVADFKPNTDILVADIHDELGLRGVEINSTTPRATIATTLSRLVERGVLYLSEKGSGKLPNRYRRSPTGAVETQGDIVQAVAREDSGEDDSDL